MNNITVFCRIFTAALLVLMYHIPAYAHDGAMMHNLLDAATPVALLMLLAVLMRRRFIGRRVTRCRIR